MLLLLLLREVRYVASAVAVAVVGSSRRKPKTRRRQVEVCTLMQPVAWEILVVINWLDLYTVESAALHGGWCNTRAW